ncbi:MAG: DUF3604 domain-containing protein [Candidatus Binataceae bacterium]
MSREKADRPGFSILILAGVASVSRPVRARDASVYRSVPADRQPTYPPITDIDARKATPPPRFEVKAPRGAPNVLVILIDILGYSTTKTFGGVIETPTLERLPKVDQRLIPFGAQQSNLVAASNKGRTLNKPEKEYYFETKDKIVQCSTHGSGRHRPRAGDRRLESLSRGPRYLSGRGWTKGTQQKKPDYSPYPDQHFPKRVFWGVAHVHTGYSFDSGMFGVTLTPDDLFKVASGGEVVMDNGQRFKQDRPLDWVSITDHAEYMGISDQIRAGSPELLADPQGKRWYEMSKTSPQEGVKAAIEAVVSMQTGKPVFDASKLTAGAWAHAIAAAEKWNQPGVFTTLHGFEWISAPGGNNLHRTVVFRDGADRVKQVVPFSTFDSQDPADLWKYMDAYAKKTGGQVLAIPHNGNLSNGMMYSAESFDGKPMDRAYAEARASHEPLARGDADQG